MADSNYEVLLPRENLKLIVFAHDIANYRYHWHPDDYELSILLSGTQEYCRGDKSFRLSENDVILTPPGTGHASMRHEPLTRALVLHFPSTALKLIAKRGYVYDFTSCLSNEENRDEERFKKIRFFAANIFNAAKENSAMSMVTVRANLELLLVTLFTEFDPKQMNLIDEDDKRVATMRLLLKYVEEHYAEKTALEDLADYIGYNRTYVSTLFKQMVGINFHEYLTRVRFQHALNDLTYTNDNLTDIALKNGFSDLKTMTARFRLTLSRSPAQYRAEINPDEVLRDMQRAFLDSKDEDLKQKLNELTKVGK